MKESNKKRPAPGKVAVFLTAYNEEKVIAGVLAQIDPAYHSYVIDDGSSDRTVEISRAAGAKVVCHPVNLGQGGAVLTAFNLLLDMDYDVIVEMDGDGQHDPREIPMFLEKLESTGVDIVAGSRVLGSDYKGAPIARKLFLKPLTILLNRLTGYHISDSMCGFRAFRCAAFNEKKSLFSEMLEPEYIASEMWLRFSHAGLTADEVPVTLAGRRHGFSYKGLFRYGWGVFSTIIRTKLSILKDNQRLKRKTS
jgi:glycosyltransferase involved in cell wall biosynthesis